MIILRDPKQPENEIVLTGQFQEQDAEVLVRTFPELRRVKSGVPAEQLSLFSTEVFRENGS